MWENLRDDRQYRIDVKEWVELNDIERKIIEDINNILSQLKQSDAKFLNDIKDDGVSNNALFKERTYKYNGEKLKSIDDWSYDASKNIPGLYYDWSSYHTIDGEKVQKNTALKDLLASDKIKYKEYYDVWNFGYKEVKNLSKTKKDNGYIITITKDEQDKVLNDKFFEDITWQKNKNRNYLLDFSTISTEKLSELYEKNPSSFIDLVYTISVFKIGYDQFNYEIKNEKIVYKTSQDELKKMIDENMKIICDGLKKENWGFLPDDINYTSKNIVPMAVWDWPWSWTKWIFDLDFWQALFEYNKEWTKLNNYAVNAYKVNSNQFKLYPYWMDCPIVNKDGKKNFYDWGEPKVTIKTWGYEISFLIDQDENEKTVLKLGSLTSWLTSETKDWMTTIKKRNETTKKNDIIMSFDDKFNFNTTSADNQIKMEVWLYSNRDAYEEVQCNIISNWPVEYSPEYTWFNGQDLFDSGRLIRTDWKDVGTIKKVEKSIKKIPATWFETNALVINAWVDWSLMPNIDNNLKGDMATLDTFFQSKNIKTLTGEISYEEFKSILQTNADAVWQDTWNDALLLWRSLTFVKLAMEANPNCVFDPLKFKFTQWGTKNNQAERFVNFESADGIQIA